MSCSLFLQTGQPMEQLSLVPNLNLRRLIKDLLAEGGEGLYLHRANSDDGNGNDSGGTSSREQGRGGARRERGREREEKREYRFALVAEQILVLKVCGSPKHDMAERMERRWFRGCCVGWGLYGVVGVPQDSGGHFTSACRGVCTCRWGYRSMASRS